MIAGVVLHLNENASNTDATLESIDNDPRVQLGERVDRRVSAALDATDVNAMHEITDWILAFAGVLHLDVVYVDLETSADTNSARAEVSS